MERQDEPLLITAINELARGKVSIDSIAFLKSLEGTLQIPSTEKRVLFALNAYVAIYNKQQLALMPGASTKYMSIDNGAKVDLDMIIVEKVFHFYCLIA